jgi:hypothetical protein
LTAFNDNYTYNKCTMGKRAGLSSEIVGWIQIIFGALQGSQKVVGK